MNEMMQSVLASAQASTGTELPAAFSVAGVVSLAVCLLNCFFGYRLFKVMVAVMGGILGIVVGATVGGILDNHVVALVLMPAMAVLFAVVAFRVYLVGVFVFSGAIPALFIWVFFEPLYAVVAFVVMGVCGVIFARPYLIGVSAIPSGFAAGSVILAMLKLDSTAGAFALGAVLAALGFAFQWKTTRKLRDPEKL